VKKPHGDECLSLVLLHELVNRLAVLDHVLGLEAGEHRHPPPDRPGPQGPERGRFERTALRDPGADVEQHRDEQQRRGEVVHRRVETRPVETEHADPWE